MSRDINEQYEPDSMIRTVFKNKTVKTNWESLCLKCFLKGESTIQLCHVILTCESWAYRYKYQ